MKEFKGTKGDWSYRSNGMFFEILPYVGTVLTSDLFEEQHSNAKLIAAAPDLLEALQLCLEALETYVSDGYIMEGTIAENKAKEAIEKSIN
jgi:hypothetical protein